MHVHNILENLAHVDAASAKLTTASPTVLSEIVD